MKFTKLNRCAVQAMAFAIWSFLPVTLYSFSNPGVPGAQFPCAGQYDSSGDVPRGTSCPGEANPSRCSTSQDEEAGLLYCGYRYYNPSTGRWLSRDPIQERGGLDLYTFVANNGVISADPLGLCCGRFIVRAKPHLKVPYYKLQASGGMEYLDGFDGQYIPCDPCSCPKDKIRLVQAIKSSGGTGEGPHMDSSVTQNQANRNGSDTSLPPYPGPEGDEGPLSYQDAPNNPRKLYGETIFTMEVCAVCKDGTDNVLGCATIIFGDVKRKPSLPGGKARDKGDGVEIECSEPGKRWKDAVKDWNAMRTR